VKLESFSTENIPSLAMLPSRAKLVNSSPLERKTCPMSDNTQNGFNTGNLVLVGLRLALLATTSALIGVLAHIAWKMIAN